MEGDGSLPVSDKQILRDRLSDLSEVLNRHLARDAGINIENKKALRTWLASHQPFHWFIEFYGIMESGGFDVIIGNPPYVVYSKVAPFDLIVHSGLVRTPHGIVAFLVWQIAASSPQEVMVEQYLNPQNIGTFRLISSAANQTHFKLVVVNNQSGEVAAFVDFENDFQFDELVSAMATPIGHEPEGDFGTATQHVMNNFTIAELLAHSATVADE